MDILDHLTHRKGPVKVVDLHKTGTRMQRFNTWLALKVTNITGTMWCAYLFAALALISLPAAFAAHSTLILVAWIAQTFLQLVLLPVIMVGQNVQGAAADARAEATFKDTEAILSALALIDERQRLPEKQAAKPTPTGGKEAQ